MTLAGKLVSELEINAAAEKFYKFFKDEAFHVPKISSKIVQQVDVHEGDWDTHGHGSIKIWNYTVDGKPEVLKEQVEFDDENLKLVQIGLEGNVFNYYKVFKMTYQVVLKDLEHSSAIMTLEFEKLDDASPYPYKYLDLMNGVTKDIASHLK